MLLDTQQIKVSLIKILHFKIYNKQLIFLLQIAEKAYLSRDQMLSLK